MILKTKEELQRKRKILILFIIEENKKERRYLIKNIYDKENNKEREEK